MLAIRLRWLRMNILRGEEMLLPASSRSVGLCRLVAQWLFSAIIIYSSTQSEPVGTHYPYCHVLFCSPLGSCSHMHTHTHTHSHINALPNIKPSLLECKNTPPAHFACAKQNSKACMCTRKIEYTHSHVSQSFSLTYWVTYYGSCCLFSHTVFSGPWLVLVVCQEENVN